MSVVNKLRIILRMLARESGIVSPFAKSDGAGVGCHSRWSSDGAILVNEGKRGKQGTRSNLELRLRATAQR